MMGTQDNKGIIPRLCDSLFGLIAKQQSSELTYKVEVSYMEIYNEKVSSQIRLQRDVPAKLHYITQLLPSTALELIKIHLCPEMLIEKVFSV